MTNQISDESGPIRAGNRLQRSRLWCHGIGARSDLDTNAERAMADTDHDLRLLGPTATHWLSRNNSVRFELAQVPPEQSNGTVS
ncbi:MULTISPECIES: hypothetical protein [unclassified Roseitalea]|uniref:hypothetical protein n=1 Tax=unclassified Roseitalea TaxID=2639107 RepID=UPI00273EF923|nr:MULTISPECIES: hypothetical protein [unclassified Roseitalea]